MDALLTLVAIVTLHGAYDTKPILDNYLSRNPRYLLYLEEKQKELLTISQQNDLALLYLVVVERKATVTWRFP